MSDVQEGAPTRRVRPWIAALLTFLNWGLGLYYARRPGAVRLAIVQLIIGVAIGVPALVIIALTPADLGQFFSPDRWSLTHTINLGLTTLVAIWVWRAVAQTQTAPRASAARLFGYLMLWLAPILVALLLAMTLRFFALHPFRQTSASMAPTLSIGQYFVVEKWSYGYSRYSFAPLENFLPSGRWLATAPQRGDVVVFRPPHEPTRDFVKRIVGMPGDVVQMIGGALYINRAPVPREHLGEATLSFGDGQIERVQTFRETLPNGVTITTYERGDSELDNTRAFRVPEGHYFVVGDNRDFSDDSRRSIGFVPFENIIGRVIVRER